MPDAVRLVRHATLQLELGGHRLLVDPMLGPARSRPPVANTPNQRPNPLVDLPEPPEVVLGWAHAVLVTHLHADHLDPVAIRLLGAGMPVLCQPDDVQTLRSQGVEQAVAVDEATEWEGVGIVRTDGRHGTGDIGAAMAPVSGFVVRAAGHSVYVAGDTIWCPEVAEALRVHAPDVVVVNAGAARFLEGDPITMTPGDVLQVRRAAGEAVVIAVHMEAINHCLVTRAQLREAVGDADVRMPADGEAVAF